MMRVAIWLTLLASSTAVAQGTKPAAKPTVKQGPIVAGGSSTARPATVAAAPAAKPGTGAAASAAGAKPMVAANTAAPAAGTKAPATTTPPAANTKAPVTAAVPAAVPGGKPAAVVPAPAGKPAVVEAAPAVPTATPATSATPASGAQAGGASITIEREAFGYDRGTRRDPFTSLLQADELRPVLSDLKLTGVIVDSRGRNSIALLRDLSTKEIYRLRTGQTIGRLRVTQIHQHSVTFVIEEFGVSRQEVLSLRDSTTARKP